MQIPVGKEDEDEEMEEMEGADGEDPEGEHNVEAVAKLRSRKDAYYTLAHGQSEDISHQPKMLVSTGFVVQ